MELQEGSITPIELQAELDTLRSLRRRSISQPSEGIDPDLPPSPSQFTHSSPPISPTHLHHVSAPSEGGSDAAGPSSSHGLGHRLGESQTIQEEPEEMNEDQPLADNLSELFWLPARLHPEIAPQEFRNFIRDQTRPENLLRRSGSQLGRRKSMLSRQYQPSDTDSEYPGTPFSDVDSTPATTPPMSRRPSRQGSFRRSTGLERLTLADLQKLETIARQAAEEGQTGEEGEAQLKRLVRRSLSLNPAAILGAADQLRDDDTYIEDDTDSPLIVPPPGSILRRSARTKIRKNSLLGDGNGHRFGPSRRGTKLTESTLHEDASGFTPERRQASISSLTSIEDEQPTSPSRNRRKSNEIRQTSPRSPDNSQIILGAIPTQYMPPVGALTEQKEAADLGTQGNDHMFVTTSRAGADMPSLEKSTSPPQSWSARSPAAHTDELHPGKHSLVNGGSLRTTKRIVSPPPTSPEHADRSATLLSSSPHLSPPFQESISKSAVTSAGLSVERESSEHVDTQMQEPRPTLPQKISDHVTVSASKSTQASPAFTSTATERQPATTSSQSTQSVRTSERQSVSIQAKPTSPSQIPRPAPMSPTQVPTSGKEKEKKSAWAKLGLSRSARDDSEVDDAASIASSSSGGSAFSRKGKKAKKDKVQPDAAPEKRASLTSSTLDKSDKQEGGSFFGGLFGKKRSEQNEQPKKDGSTPSPILQMPTPPPTASGMLTPDGKYINFYRLPIHIERAVYRLSHIKLANPRRPLYEQVLISNLMFWYLGVINKPVVPPSHMQQRPAHPQPVAPQAAAAMQIISHEASGSSDPTTRPRQSSRPSIMRESSNGTSTADTYDAASLTPETDLHEEETAQATRPSSHPPRRARSPGLDSAIDDPAARPRPQTMPASHSGLSQTALGPSDTDVYDQKSSSRQPLMYAKPSVEIHDSTSHNVLSSSVYISEHRLMNELNTIPKANKAARAYEDEDLDATINRRSVPDVDTYDIIAAYADEERRKSMVLQQDGSPPRASKSPPSIDSKFPSGPEMKHHEDRSRGGRTATAPYRPTPPRQSSMGTSAIGQQQQTPAGNHHTGRSHITLPTPRPHSPHSAYSTPS